MEKACAVCKEIKDEGLFHNHPKTKDGKDARCKECVKLQKRRAYHEEGGREKKLLYYKNKVRSARVVESKTIAAAVQPRLRDSGGAKGIRRSFSFRDKDVISINEFKLKNRSRSFGEAFKQMIEISSDKKRYFRKSGFDNSCAELSKNYDQIRKILVNLEQLSRLQSLGRIPDFLKQAELLKDLLSLYSRAKFEIDHQIYLIKQHAPENR